MVWGLGVRVPASSLFHDEKFAFFDFGVRGTPKISKICLGVSPQSLREVGVLSGAAKGFRLRREAAPPLFAATRQIRPAKALCGTRQHPHFSQRLGGNP